jgi:hypothetical protein
MTVVLAIAVATLLVAAWNALAWPRLRLVPAEPLPAGRCGKTFACAGGACGSSSRARGRAGR